MKQAIKQTFNVCKTLLFEKENIEYLIDLLRANNIANKRNKKQTPTIASPSTVPPNAVNTSISVCSNPTTTNAVPSLVLPWALVDHEKFMKGCIHRWYDENKENFKN